MLRVLVAGGLIVLAACATSTDSAKPTPTKATPAPTTAAPGPTTPPITYQVKRGDTLTAIARYFGVSSAAVAAANQLASADRLTEGQVLQIPPAPPAGLTVTPPDGVSGDTFTFAVNGAKSGENVTFEIQRPGGGVFTGSPHTATQDGAVIATYMSTGDGPGMYTVVATGDRGTSLRAEYRLLG